MQRSERPRRRPAAGSPPDVDLSTLLALINVVIAQAIRETEEEHRRGQLLGRRAA
jgi:hypothetical protein